MDRVIGVRVGAILFSSLIMLGQAVFAMGVQWDIFWLSCVGRFIFGL